MFDIAWSELFVILVVALVVVGPKDLPRLMRKVGQWAGKARAMADQFRRSFDDMARQAELDDLHAEVKKLKGDVVSSPLAEVEYEAYAMPKTPDGIPTLDDISKLEDGGAAVPETPGLTPVETPPVSSPSTTQT